MKNEANCLNFVTKFSVLFAVLLAFSSCSHRNADKEAAQIIFGGIEQSNKHIEYFINYGIVEHSTSHKSIYQQFNNKKMEIVHAIDDITFRFVDYVDTLKRMPTGVDSLPAIRKIYKTTMDSLHAYSSLLSDECVIANTNASQFDSFSPRVAMLLMQSQMTRAKWRTLHSNYKKITENKFIWPLVKIVPTRSLSGDDMEIKLRRIQINQNAELPELEIDTVWHSDTLLFSKPKIEYNYFPTQVFLPCSLDFVNLKFDGQMTFKENGEITAEIKFKKKAK